MADKTSLENNESRKKAGAGGWYSTSGIAMVTSIKRLLTMVFVIAACSFGVTSSGMINCEGTTYHIEDDMILYIMCCGKQLYDARLSRCNKKQSSMTSHVHFHDPGGMPPRIAMDSISIQGRTEVLNEETNILTYNHQKKASPKKPYCTEDDTLMWTSAIDNFKTDSDDEAYAYFSPGSVGCCGRRFYRTAGFFCCGSVLYPKTGHGQLCCGGVYYPTTLTPQYLVCCNNTLVDVRARPGCATGNPMKTGDRWYLK